MMTGKGILMLCLLFGLLSARERQTMAPGGRVKVVISGYKDTKGLLQVALFNTEKDFMEKPFKAQKVSIQPETTEVVFEELPAGWYTVGVYQDKNENDKLDKNLVGYPKEPYGFSNDAQNKLSAPDYNKAKFEVKDQEVLMRVKLD